MEAHNIIDTDVVDEFEQAWCYKLGIFRHHIDVYLLILSGKQDHASKKLGDEIMDILLESKDPKQYDIAWNLMCERIKRTVSSEIKKRFMNFIEETRLRLIDLIDQEAF